MGELMKNWRNT